MVSSFYPTVIKDIVGLSFICGRNYIFGWPTLGLFSCSPWKVENNYHQNFQHCTEFVFYWAFKIILLGLHATDTTKAMDLAGSRSEQGNSPCPVRMGQLALFSNDYSLPQTTQHYATTMKSQHFDHGDGQSKATTTTINQKHSSLAFLFT
jgi:hypothetical protein